MVLTVQAYLASGQNPLLKPILWTIKNLLVSERHANLQNRILSVRTGVMCTFPTFNQINQSFCMFFFYKNDKFDFNFVILSDTY